MGQRSAAGPTGALSRGDGRQVMKQMKPTAHLLNFSRAEIVDGGALRRLYDQAGHTGKYICDFADEHMQEHPQFMCIPHLGASTAEAEDNCARMAAEQLVAFIERGHVVNSVNFPTAILEQQVRRLSPSRPSPRLMRPLTTAASAAGR